MDDAIQSCIIMYTCQGRFIPDNNQILAVIQTQTAVYVSLRNQCLTNLALLKLKKSLLKLCN